MIELNKIICGDALEELKKLPDGFVDCVVTSPPYYDLRDYGVEGQLGLEKKEEVVGGIGVAVFCVVTTILVLFLWSPVPHNALMYVATFIPNLATHHLLF